MYTTLISPETLYKHLNDPNWRIFDCRFALADPDWGRQAYEQAHIPGALYADLDKDLSGSILARPGGFTETGRHPLPDVDVFVATLNRWGVTNKTQAVAYDDKGGGLAAARLWWLLRWVGHDVVAVLDSGWQGWIRKEYSVGSKQSSPVNRLDSSSVRPFIPHPRPELLATTEDVEGMIHNANYLIVDSRAPERYRGETEPIDPIAGRIPSAANAPYGATQIPEGNFRPVEDLRAQFKHLIGDIPPRNTVFYCGSGVTAAANLLAMKHAELGDGKLYAGSWSSWIADQSHPIEKG
jgi:thiosulfate/3-mercaptopyruvate sulfurtransferase